MSEHAPNVRIDDLLAHAGWVRGLALSLVRDPGAADDLVQETWLAAMRKPPRGDGPVRGWLAGVVRNLARQRWRGEGRRAAREAVVGERREPLPSTGELAVRMETQRDLAEAILELAEPLRATVILRYLEGHSSAEIARRLGVPSATVRGRLKRGIEELRLKLDGRHGGDRRAWTAALLPFLPKLPSPGATGVAAAMLSGVLAMSLTAKLLSSTVLVLAILGLLAATNVLSLGDEGSDAPASREALLAASMLEDSMAQPTEKGPGLQGAGRAPAEAASSRDAAEPKAPESGTLPGRIKARIVDEDGRGIEGATLRVAQGEERRAQSGEGGQIELRIDRVSDTHPRQLIAHAAGHRLREISARVRASETLDLGDIALAPGGTVRGRVVDGAGRPVLGASVVATLPDLAPFERARGPVSGPLGHPLPLPRVALDGSFELPGLPVGFVRVWASYRGMRYTVTEPVEVRPDRDTVRDSEQIVIVLKPLRPKDAIRGLILHADDTPAADATVHYSYRHANGSSSSSVVTEQDGSFELRMAHGGTATLRFSSDDGYSAPVLRGVAPSATVLRIVLKKSRTLRLAVKKSDGRPLAGVSVFAKSTVGPRVISWHSGTFEEGGIAELQAPSEGYKIEVTASGYRGATFGPFEAGDDPGLLEALLEPLPSLRGRVTSGGKPVANARVRVHVPTKQNERVVHNGFDVHLDPATVGEARTDADGFYAVGISEGGHVILRVDAMGYAPAERTERRVDAERGEEGLDVELGRGGSISGVIRMGSLRSPVGLVVGVSRADGYALTQRTGVGGAYRFGALMPGAYEVRIVEQEIVSGSSSTTQHDNVQRPEIEWSCRVRAGETTEYDIDLRAEAAKQAVLAGRVLVDGKPPRGWIYQLMEEPGESGMPQTLERGTLDGEGRFRATAKKAGAYRILVSSEGQAQGRRGFFIPLQLDQGLNEWSISVETGTVEGTFASGAPDARVRIFLLWSAPGGEFGLTQIQPDEDGSFRLEGVFAGKTRLVRLDRETMGKMSPKDALNPENWPVVIKFEVKPGVLTKVRIP